MGGQISVPQRAKPGDLDTYGVFKLRQSQKFSLNVLSDIITMLIADNNLFDLAEMLKTEMGCQSLVIVIKNKLEKDFTTLQFPDQSKAGEFTSVGFLSDQKYKTLAQRDKDRSIYCAQFAFFIVRFTLLLSALVASVSFQEDMYKDLKANQLDIKPSGINERYKNLADMSLRGDRLPSDILGVFLEKGNLKKIPSDTRPLYYFGSQDSVVVDADKGIVYSPQSATDTGVLKISIHVSTLAPAAAPAQVPYALPVAPAPYGLPVAPAPVLAPAAAPFLPAGPAPRPYPPAPLSNAPSNSSAPYRLNPLTRQSNIFSTSGVSTSSRGRSRKGRRSTRKRAHRGGAVVFRVILSSVVCAETGTCEISQFDIDEYGNTYAVGTTTAPMSFADRVSPILARQTKRYLLENPGVLALQSKSKFSNFAKLDTTAYSVLSYYQNAIVGKSTEKENITSPAIYRAFLLATGVVEDRVDTLFCNDAWRGVMTSAIPYALLQSLYYDENGGTKSSGSADELRTVSANFLNTDIARPYVQNSAITPTEFSQLAFVEPKTIAPAFCGAVTTGVRSTNIEAHRAILTKAHQEIHGLYDEHLETIVKFIRKILSLREAGYGQRHVIRLNPVFVTNTKGGQAALDGLIQEGRTLIASHYLAVETTYKKAIQAIANLGRGVAPVASQQNMGGRITTSTRPDVPLPARFSRNVVERGLGQPNV